MKVIASHNGFEAARRAYALLGKGHSPLEACVEGISLVEDDPNDVSVGYGGLPNELGIVELDAAVMDGKTHRGAGIAALRNVRHPTQVALRLLQQTNRCLLVGEGALEFARANGFREESLLTDLARRMWMYWRRQRATGHDWLPPPPEDHGLELQTWFQRHFYRRPGQGPEPDREGGTVHCAALDEQGNVACATSTSGHAFKLPGRVGDSPILGAGLYADNEVGSCGSIGHGEANLENLTSFLAVDLMRQGRSPTEAGWTALQRVVEKTRERDRDDQGRPTFNLQLFLLHRDGRHAGVALWGPKHIAVSDAQGSRLEECVAMFATGVVH